MNVKERLLESWNQKPVGWRREKRRIIGDEYDQSTPYTCVKIA
jgi:hypothetical protein